MRVVGVYEVPGVADAHLVELATDDPPTEVDLRGVTQEEPGSPRDSWQAPWMERYLDPGGERLLTEEFDPPPPELATTRVVFFMHFLVFDRPLLTPRGPVELPRPTPLPERLRPVRYEPVD